MRFALLITLISISSSITTLAQDWPQWRGPRRDGTVDAAMVPDAWPAATSRLWRLEVGEGYSSPVVAGSRVFVHSRRDPQEIVTAIDIASGRVLWQQQYAASFTKNQYAVRMAKGPNSTPLVAGEVVYTLGMTGILSAWRASDGTLVWRNDYSSSVDTSKLFCGTAMSPLAEGGAIVVHVGSDVHGGQVIALDPASGKARWTSRSPGPGYASPIAITAAGVPQIITLTNQSIVAIDAKTGGPLWSIPFADEWHENIITPSWTGTHLVVSGVRQGTQAYAITRAGDHWNTELAWKNADVTMYMSAPVVVDRTVYGFSNKRKGQFVALDAATGAVRWATEGREGDHASILATPNHVLYLTNAGELVVTRRKAAAFKEERRIRIADSEMWATPAFVQGGVIVREGDALTRLQWTTN